MPTIIGMNGSSAWHPRMLPGDYNYHVFDTDRSTNTTWVDMAGFGRGRKMFGLFVNTNTTLLRGFFLKTFSLSDGMAVTYAYKSYNTLSMNVISATDIQGDRGERQRLSDGGAGPL